MTRELSYLIVGGGALGSALAAYLTAAGRQAALLARGDHLAQIREKGLTLHVPDHGTPQEQPMSGPLPKGQAVTVPVRALGEDDIDNTYDVVFVTVKEYSLDSVVPLLKRVASETTVIIPLLNAVGTGERIARAVTCATVTEGMAYVGAERLGPGAVLHKVDFFRIVMGPRTGQEMPPILEEVAADLRSSGLTVEISDSMMTSALEKLVRVGTLSATMLLIDGRAGDIAADPAAMSVLRDLCHEVARVGDALGAPIEPRVIEDVLAMVGAIPPSYRTSLKEDWDSGRATEVKAQILDVVELGRRAGVAMPTYQHVIDSLGLAASASDRLRPQKGTDS